jgi:hypothetical protein
MSESIWKVEHSLYHFVNVSGLSPLDYFVIFIYFLLNLITVKLIFEWMLIYFLLKLFVDKSI